MSDSTPPPEVQPAPNVEAAGEQPDEKKKEDSMLDNMSQEVQDYVKDIKSKGVSVFVTFLADRAYLFRPLKVMEFTQLQTVQRQRAQAEGATEEFLQSAWLDAIVFAGNIGVILLDDLGVEHLHPAVTRENIKAQPAGVPTTLSQQILIQSGFDDNPMTVKL